MVEELRRISKVIQIETILLRQYVRSWYVLGDEAHRELLHIWFRVYTGYWDFNSLMGSWNRSGVSRASI